MCRHIQDCTDSLTYLNLSLPLPTDVKQICTYRRQIASFKCSSQRTSGHLLSCSICCSHNVLGDRMMFTTGCEDELQSHVGTPEVPKASWISSLRGQAGLTASTPLPLVCHLYYYINCCSSSSFRCKLTDSGFVPVLLESETQALQQLNSYHKLRPCSVFSDFATRMVTSWGKKIFTKYQDCDQIHYQAPIPAVCSSRETHRTMKSHPTTYWSMDFTTREIKICILEKHIPEMWKILTQKEKTLEFSYFLEFCF